MQGIFKKILILLAKNESIFFLINFAKTFPVMGTIGFRVIVCRIYIWRLEYRENIWNHVLSLEIFNA